MVGNKMINPKIPTLTGWAGLRSFAMAVLTLIMLEMAITNLRAESPAPAASGDILAANLDRSVDPGQDFFDYANGGWLARNPIPASESGWGIGNLVDEELYVKLRTINEQAAQAHAPAGSDEQKVGDFWTTAMDEAKADRLGITPLNAELALIDAIKTVPEAIDVSFALRPVGMEAFCDVSVSQDEKQSDAMSVHLTQGGLGTRASRISGRSTWPTWPGCWGCSAGHRRTRKRRRRRS
jgi:putative endopeptidase